MNIPFILALVLCPVVVFGSKRSPQVNHDSEISDKSSVAHLTASASSISGSRSYSGASGSAAGSAGHFAYASQIDDPNIQHTGSARYARNDVSGKDGEITKVYLYDVQTGKGQGNDGSPVYYNGKEGGHQTDQHGGESHESETGNTHFTGTATGYVTGKTKIVITGTGVGYTSGAGQEYSSGSGSDYTPGSSLGYSSGGQYSSQHPSDTGYGYTGNEYSSDGGYGYGSGTGSSSASGQEYTPGTGRVYTSGSSKGYSSGGSKGYTSGTSKGYSSGASGHGSTYTSDDDTIYTGSTGMESEHPWSHQNTHGSTINGGFSSYETGKGYTPQSHTNSAPGKTEVIISSNSYDPAGRFPTHNADSGYTSGHTAETGHSSGIVYTSGTGYSSGSSYPSGKGYTPGVGKFSTGTGRSSDAGTTNSQTKHTATIRHTKSHRRTTTESDHEHDHTTEKMNSRRTTPSTHHTKNTMEDGRGKTTKTHHSDHEVQSGSTFGQCNCNKFEVAYQWNYFNFSWNCPLKMAQMRYSPADYIPLSFDIYNHSLYMTFPRLRRNSRITLAKMCMTSSIVNPVLTPFPSWEMNSGNTCDTLQDVTKIQIDKDGVMWVLDGRRLNPAVNCPPKLMLLDLKHNGKILKKYDIPDDLCKKHGCLLNDLVVDGDYAFISDLSAGEEGIIVYNRRKNRSWKARATGHDESNFRHHPRDNCSPNMYNHEISRAVAWIALAPPCSSKNRTFMYIPESLPYGFGINVDILKDERKATGDLTKYFTQELSKRGATGAAIYDSKGTLFLGMLTERTVAMKYWGQKELTVCPKMYDLIRYPGTFAIDNDSGSLYMSEMSSLNFGMTGVDVRKNNFKILKLKTESKNYMHCTAKH